MSPKESCLHFAQIAPPPQLAAVRPVTSHQASVAPRRFGAVGLSGVAAVGAVGAVAGHGWWWI